jgi:flavin-dependent dehydrogenase
MNYDIAILGAGPAGLCAALRLAGLGYRVALSEVCRFPRPQIGESLSPGIYSLFDYIGTRHLLNDARYLRELPSRVLWEEEIGQLISKDGFLVDRASLDAALLSEVIARGVDFYPAVDSGMYSSLSTGHVFPAGTVIPGARITLDARGRRGVKAVDRLLTAPSSLALWTQVSATVMPFETRVEALPAGWLWGAPLPVGSGVPGGAGGEYRVMAFVDSATVKAQGAYAVLRGMVAESRLFADILPVLSGGRLQTCPVVQYMHRTPWRDDYIRIGEAAFTIDPLSSSGVEKAMRHALQAVIAVNTLLRGDNPALARRFFEDKLMKSVSDHQGWTTTYYGKAWPGSRYPFWKTRSESLDLTATGTIPDRPRRGEEASHVSAQTPVNVTQLLNQVWESVPLLSPLLSYEQACCVVNDIVQLRTGISHPCLPGEMVYLGGVEVKPLLDMIPSVSSFGELLHRWSNIMPVEQAGKMLAFLWERGVIFNHLAETV